MTLHSTHIFNQLYENTFFLLKLLVVSGNMNKRNLPVQRFKTKNNITYNYCNINIINENLQI